MGAPMCGHLISAGHQLFVNTRGNVPATIAETSATQYYRQGRAERADIIFIMVPDTPDVEGVLFGTDGGSRPEGAVPARSWWTCPPSRPWKPRRLPSAS
ncbi:NAD(P)-dependent oxidoreductase, partial [Staphylococcus epidermidis]|nr:NAD(P)-dependent oxidoreductase [Staphylococcus epidermidis]